MSDLITMTEVQGKKNEEDRKKKHKPVEPSLVITMSHTAAKRSDRARDLIPGEVGPIMGLGKYNEQKVNESSYEENEEAPNVNPE